MSPQKKLKYTKHRKYPKTVRRHRHSTTGQIFPPLYVNSSNEFSHIQKYINQGPITIVIFSAPWCHFCKELKPHIKAAAKLPTRNVQLIVVRDDMVSGYNQAVNGFNRSAFPINVSEFPTIIAVAKDGKQITEFAPTQQALMSAMVNVAPVAENAGLVSELNTSVSRTPSYKRNIVKPRNGSPEHVIESIVTQELDSPKKNSRPISFEHLSNEKRSKQISTIDESVIESIKGPAQNSTINSMQLNSVRTPPDNGASHPIDSLTFYRNMNASDTSKGKITESVPSSAIRSTINEITSDEARKITSLSATPEAKLVSPDIHKSDFRTKKQTIIGGTRGGSLHSIMSQTAYHLAPTAVLLATAAAVIKRKTRSKKKINTRKKRYYRK